tara:strand:+ start:1502 stop:3244 length:1743 start_codon:yes stop_codon:yes gene_type:complete
MDIDVLVESFYQKADNDNFVNEVLKFLLVEADALTPPKATFDWSMIPDIPISEIGWSDVSTIEEDGETKTILGPQRALLEQYLDNIGVEGGDFQQQIESLETFYKNGPSQIVAAAGDDRVEVIKKLISYLVFYKTLTKVVTNFNAASAGFTFESFLATLLKGTQIPTNSNTIADFTTGANVPISLKLYAEKTLHVEGSFTDLVNDLVEPKYSHPDGNAMRYILCTKRITGDGLKQAGTIGFYQFDFTLDNVFAILATSMTKSQKCLYLPMEFVESVRGGAAKDYSAGLPARENLPSAEVLESEWRANALARLKQLPPDHPVVPSAEEFEQMLDTIDYAKSDRYFAPSERGDVIVVLRGMSKLPHSKELKQVVRDVYSESHPKVGATALNVVSKILHLANEDILERLKASELKKQRKAALDATEWMTDMGELVEFYKGLPAAHKALALKNTLGYMDTFQFALNRKQSTTDAPPINTQKFGVLSIGGQNVEIMLKQVSSILNDEIFTVFTSLKTLSDSLNGFFAGGLSDKDSGLAVQAIASADEIQKKTAKASGQKPGPEAGTVSSMAGPVPAGQRRYIQEE